MKNYSKAFLALVKSGLWEQVVRLSPFGRVNYKEVFRLAQEQTVLGLVTAGLNHVTDVEIPYETRLMFLGSVSEIEQRNKAMNQFVVSLVAKMQAVGIKAVLVKGQGAAQFYARPQWRTTGDIDFLLDEENYEKAKALLCPLADKVEIENKKAKHLGLVFREVTVELHGRMPFSISHRVDCVIDANIKDLFEKEKYRVWGNGIIEFYLPNPDDDVVIIFTHFLHHFFIEGVGLKQICDWCRLLWIFREEIDRALLEERLGRMGLMSEWKAFASLAVNHLGMPEEAMPFYEECYRRKGDMVLSHILKTGNLGHNNNQKYRSKLSKPLANTVTFFRRICDYTKFAFIFPIDSPLFLMTYLANKIKTA